MSKLIINFDVEFFFREKDRTSKLIIKMQGQMTSIYNPETPSKKNYLFLHRFECLCLLTGFLMFSLHILGCLCLLTVI